MAKAYAYLRRQCRFIDFFGEFGELYLILLITACNFVRSLFFVFDSLRNIRVIK